MAKAHKLTLLGTGLIARMYAETLRRGRRLDRIEVVYSQAQERAAKFAEEFEIADAVSDLRVAIEHPATDIVVIGLPNHLHEESVRLAAAAGKAVLLTKPLARNAEEAWRILEAVEKAGVFAGYLEDLVYTPKALKSIRAVQAGQIGQVTWVRAREAHPGPHSAWFWDAGQAGGGAIVDLGCHCIEIGRSYVGKQNRPVEAMCWAGTLVHPIEAEDNAIGLVRYESGAVAQFEVSWTFRGGMDLRDEVAGTEGTIWLNHFLRTGFEIFSTGAGSAYVAEKAETAAGWLFPVGDEQAELGYTDMFDDMLNAMDENRAPVETFYDGYVVNAVMDACYASMKSKRWEAVELKEWRGGPPAAPIQKASATHEGYIIIKSERMPDGRLKRILKDPRTGSFFDVLS